MPNSKHSAPNAKSRAYILQRIAAEAKKRLHKNQVGLMNETVNPLWDINERQAQLVYDYARTGNYAQIQYLYNEIEERDPTLLVCVTRRTSAVAELDWRVVRSDERLNRKADKNLIQEQIECVETAMAKVDNMPDALEHLALSAFRGFSLVAPIHDVSGDLKHLDLIDSWNLCFDRLGQSWYFNPTASSFAMPTSKIGRNAFKGLQYIPREQICAVTRKREIDWPAMQIFLRASIGERDWGRFLETYGLPPVIITMPEFTSKDEQEAYVQAAASVFEGRSGVVPFGSNVSYGSESRGTNPFTEFIEHQQKLVVMMATGGTLASLAESTGLGNGASDVQQDEWLRIIRADKRIISNAINKQICEPILRANKDFKDKPILAEFQLDDTPKPTPKEMLELASTAASAGFEMDAEELSQACGFTLRKKVEGGNPFDGGGGEPTPSVTIPDGPSNPNGDDEEHHEDAGTVTNVDEGADKNDNAAAESTKTPQKPVSRGADAAGADIVASLQKDFKPVADRLAQILALPEEERAAEARKMIVELPSLVPDDLTMAEVIAGQMEAAFKEQLKKQPDGGAPAANRAVPNSVHISGIPNDECRVRGHLCRIHDKKQIEELQKKTPDQLTADGSKAMDNVIATRKDAIGASYRESTGPIDFEYGFEGTPEKNYHDGYGMSHIFKAHPKDFKALSGVIAHGSVYSHPNSEDRVGIISGKRLVILEKDGDGSYVVTGFTPKAPDKYLSNFVSDGKLLESAR